MTNFSPGWGFGPPTELKFCCDYMANFSPGAMLNGKICRKAFYIQNASGAQVLRKWYIQNASGVVRTFKTQVVWWVHSKRRWCAYFSPNWNLNAITWNFQPGLWNRAGNFSPGWNSLNVIVHFFLRVLFRKPSWNLRPANRAEIRHVIGPLAYALFATTFFKVGQTGGTVL